LQDNNDIHDPNEQMPGQKPMEESAMVKTIKTFHSMICRCAGFSADPES
jgi:hypothetical protein